MTTDWDKQRVLIEAEIMATAAWPYPEREAYKSGLYAGLAIAAKTMNVTPPDGDQEWVSR